jgi:hypothetical protein
MSVIPNNRNLVAVVYNPLGIADPDYPYNVLKVKFKNGGERFFMDLAGA